MASFKGNEEGEMSAAPEGLRNRASLVEGVDEDSGDLAIHVVSARALVSVCWEVETLGWIGSEASSGGLAESFPYLLGILDSGFPGAGLFDSVERGVGSSRRTMGFSAGPP
jgi:hypothetical protein